MIMLARGVRRRVGVGDRHHDRERRAVGRRREPLLAVDHVVVAVASPRSCPAASGSSRPSRARSSRSSCGSRPSTSGRRKRSFCSSVAWRWRISMLPASGACEPNTECPSGLRPSASAQQAVIDHRQPEPAELHRMVRGPQTHLADLRLGGDHQLLHRLGRPVQHLALDRYELVVDELADHRQDGLHLLRHLEVHVTPPGATVPTGRTRCQGRLTSGRSVRSGVSATWSRAK